MQRIGWSLKFVRGIERDISRSIDRWIGRNFDLSSRGIDRSYAQNRSLVRIADIIWYKLSWLASHTQGNTHPRPNLGECAASAARCIRFFPGAHDVPFTASSTLYFIENQDIHNILEGVGEGTNGDNHWSLICLLGDVQLLRHHICVLVDG